MTDIKAQITGGTQNRVIIGDPNSIQSAFDVYLSLLDESLVNALDFADTSTQFSTPILSYLDKNSSKFPTSYTRHLAKTESNFDDWNLSTISSTFNLQPDKFTLTRGGEEKIVETLDDLYDVISLLPKEQLTLLYPTFDWASKVSDLEFVVPASGNDILPIDTSGAVLTSGVVSSLDIDNYSTFVSETLLEDPFPDKITVLSAATQSTIFGTLGIILGKLAKVQLSVEVLSTRPRYIKRGQDSAIAALEAVMRLKMAADTLTNSNKVSTFSQLLGGGLLRDSNVKGSALFVKRILQIIDLGLKVIKTLSNEVVRNLNDFADGSLSVPNRFFNMVPSVVNQLTQKSTPSSSYNITTPFVSSGVK